MSHLKILGARRVTSSKLHSEDPHTKNLDTTVTWHTGFVHH